MVAKHTTLRAVVHVPELAARIAYAVSPARNIVVAPTDGLAEVAAVDAVAADATAARSARIGDASAAW